MGLIHEHAESGRGGRNGGKGRKSTHFNTLLPAELEYTDNFSGALESVARVRVEKLGTAVAA